MPIQEQPVPADLAPEDWKLIKLVLQDPASLFPLRLLAAEGERGEMAAWPREIAVSPSVFIRSGSWLVATEVQGLCSEERP